ncbi:MAG: HlyD family secretion protein, partial [Hyphomicrobiaceae bacterium]
MSIAARRQGNPPETLSEPQGTVDATTEVKSLRAPSSPLVGKQEPGKGPAEVGEIDRIAPPTPSNDVGGQTGMDELKGSGKKKHKPLVKGLIGIVAVIALTAFGIQWWLVGRFMVSTDDAYVGADLALLSARVPARVMDVPLEANQKVKKGEVLVVLDDGDFKLAVDQAKAQLATQKARIVTIGRQIVAAHAQVKQMQANLTAAKAEVERAEADFERTRSLAADSYSSKATLDQRRAERDKARAGVIGAEASVASADASVGVLEAQKTEAEHTATEMAVMVAKAERDLDATRVRAPMDGIVGNKSVQVGDYVVAGKRLAAI